MWGSASRTLSASITETPCLLDSFSTNWSFQMILRMTTSDDHIILTSSRKWRGECFHESWLRSQDTSTDRNRERQKAKGKNNQRDDPDGEPHRTERLHLLRLSMTNAQHYC